MWYKNIAGRFFGLVTKHACDRQTDGRTDRQNYDSQDRASIAASRGKKNLWVIKVTPPLGVTLNSNEFLVSVQRKRVHGVTLNVQEVLKK